MYWRRAKESHRDTISYETDMLNFCVQAVGREYPTREDAWVYLEAFLLHYRNLIRVFSGGRSRRDDLSVTNAANWLGRELTPEEAANIKTPAQALDTA